MQRTLSFRQWIVGAVVLILLSVMLLTNAPTAYAAAIVVNSGADTTVGGDGDCTLREAIANANSDSDTTLNDCVAGDGVNDTITFAGGVSTITTTSQLTITDTGDMLTIDGGGAVTIDGVTNSFALIQVDPAVTVFVNNITLTNGSTGIDNDGTATINNSSLSGNLNLGMFNNITGTATLNDSLVSGNSNGIRSFGTATLNNSTLTNNFGSSVIDVLNTFTINNSTISGNSGTGINFGDGTVTINNSTLSGNGGFGIFIFGFGTVNINNSTLSGNSPDGIFTGTGTVNVKNSIVADNTNADCNAITPINDQGGNFATDNTCGTFMQNANVGGAFLGPLQLNAPGTTATHALLPGNPAIDAVTDCTFIGGGVVTSDQRGVARPQGSNCDAGAFEFRPTTTAPDDVPVAVLPPCVLVDGTVNNIVRATAPDGTVTDGSVFCRIINENGVFVQNAAELGTDVLLDYGVLQAVDVFGLTTNGNSVPNFNNSIEVCLLGSGMLHYLDATQAPRTLQLLMMTQSGGFTCGHIPNAGTLVLTNSTGGAAQQQSSASAPASNTASSTTSVLLTGCRVTTLYISNLRDAPSLDSNIIRPIPFDTTYDATERTGEWFRIVVDNGQGWVNAGLVSTSGTCGG